MFKAGFYGICFSGGSGCFSGGTDGGVSVVVVLMCFKSVYLPYYTASDYYNNVMAEI